MKQTRTWVLVSDGGRARVLARSGTHLTTVAGLTLEAELPRSQALGTERPGRTHESHGAARHAYEQRSDPHEQLKAAFLGSVLAAIEARLDKGELDRLIVVAPPHALGVLRAKMSARLAALVAAEVAKDLTKTPDAEIADRLSDAVRV